MGVGMTWTKLDDGFAEHPKIVGLTDGAFRLLVRSLGYCSRWNTDGVIPRNALKVPKRLARELVSNGNWHETGHECETCPPVAKDSFYVHEYLVYNPSADEVEEAQGRRSERARKAARARWDRPDEHRNGSANGNAPSIAERMPDDMLQNAPGPGVSVVKESSSRVVPPCGKPEEEDNRSAEFDPIEIKIRAVLERFADARTEGIAPGAPGPYRARVIANAEAQHGDKLRKIIPTHPDAPVETLADWLLGNPTSLERYRIEVPS